MSFESARKVADAVLLEGYVLYPYRATSTKNRYRWAFGVLAPRAWSEAGGCEPFWMETQCLIEPTAIPALTGRLRFLQTRARTVEAAVDASGRAFQPEEALDVDGVLHVTWDEGVPREIELFDPLLEGASERVFPFELPASREEELLRDATGELRGRVVRECWSMRGAIRVRAERVAAGRPLMRLTVRVENETPTAALDAPREEMLRFACLGTHLLLGISGGAFISQIDPPDWAKKAAAETRSTRGFPVLAGAPGETDVMLGAPIILYDHPQVAPESAGDLFDATEIDEILTLRTAMLTEEEKRQARATDPRAAAVVNRAEHLPPEMMERLHGAARDLHRAEMVPKLETTFRIGTRVRLRPGRRRTDAQDLLYAGHIARVEDVKRDVDGRAFLAVTVEDDPAAELNRWYGRFHYYAVDEVELLEAERDGERSSA